MGSTFLMIGRGSVSRGEQMWGGDNCWSLGCGDPSFVIKTTRKSFLKAW